MTEVDVTALARKWGAPRLDGAHRAALVDAIVDAPVETPRSRRPWIAAGIALAVAAALALWLRPETITADVPVAEIHDSPDTTVATRPLPSGSVPRVVPVPVPLPVPAPVSPPSTAKTNVVPHSELAGSQERGSASTSIEDLPVTVETSAAAFQAGWEALRANRYADAIAAFDRATSPDVAEDAMFWAATAAEKAGDIEGARRRLTKFLVAYPESPHAKAAKAALAR